MWPGDTPTNGRGCTPTIPRGGELRRAGPPWCTPFARRTPPPIRQGRWREDHKRGASAAQATQWAVEGRVASETRATAQAPPGGQVVRGAALRAHGKRCLGVRPGVAWCTVGEPLPACRAITHLFFVERGPMVEPVWCALLLGWMCGGRGELSRAVLS